MLIAKLLQDRLVFDFDELLVSDMKIAGRITNWIGLLIKYESQLMLLANKAFVLQGQPPLFASILLKIQVLLFTLIEYKLSLI